MPDRVPEDMPDRMLEQVGMSLKLGWKFCSNETTGYQARKEMACITVGDWRLRLIELRNRFERISFFPRAPAKGSS